MRIYIAGPYSAGSETQIDANVRAAVDAGIAVFRKGHYPFVPHLTHFVDLRAKELGTKLEWEDYIRWDLEWLRQCDAVLCFGRSPGTDIEIEEARRRGIRIFQSLEEVPTIEIDNVDSEDKAARLGVWGLFGKKGTVLSNRLRRS